MLTKTDVKLGVILNSPSFSFKDIAMTEAIIVVLIVQVAGIIVAFINRHETMQNAKKVEEVKQTAETVAGQMRTNGGSTVKDQLNRIEARFDMHDERMNLLQQADINDRNAAASAHAAIYAKIDDVAKDVHMLTGKESS